MGKQRLNIIIYLLFVLFGVNSVQIIQTNTEEQTQSDKATSFAITFITIIVMIVILFAVFLGFVAILVKIYKKLSEYFYKKKGFFYEMFVNDLNNCRFNYDTKLKRRRKRYLWLFWKRQPVFFKNINDEVDILGYYEGEMYKKEGFYFIAIHTKVNLFKSISRILVIPNEIKKQIINKITIDKKTILTINCEGMDNIISTDFYFMPLLKQKKTDTGFINYSNEVFENYFKVEVYQDIIGESLLKYKHNVIKAVESDPKLNKERRKPD